jgi:hypothetical protein
MTNINHTSLAAGDAEIVLAIDGMGNITIVQDRFGNVDEVSVQVTRKIVKRSTYHFTKPEAPTSDWIAPTVPEQHGETKVAVSPENRRALLAQLIAEGCNAKISGTKADGTVYRRRHIVPLFLSAQTHLGREYLSCRDAESGERRTFRFDLIDRVEAA